MRFLTMDDFKFEGKTVFLRVDINCPLDRSTLRIKDSTRIAACLPTIRELSDKKARVVILAHQGRKGDWDFTSLREHFQTMKSLLPEKRVNFVEDTFGHAAKDAIADLRDGEILLLDNLRSFDWEQKEKSPQEHAASALVQELAPLADIFINDAFAAAHRSQCSMVGFTPLVPSAAGRLMEAELRSSSRLVQSPKQPAIFIFGGAKFSDSIKLIEYLLSKNVADRVILIGLTGLAFLKASGVDMGRATFEVIEKCRGDGHADFYDRAARLLLEYREKIMMPTDVAVDIKGERREINVGELPSEFQICDIGKSFIGRCENEIAAAKTIFISGPAGLFENPQFAEGTNRLLEAVAKNGTSFSFAGGGHTSAALCHLGLLKKFSYVSTGGGALETFMTGGRLPAVEALERWSKK